MDAAAVVERHHVDAEEEHRRNGADPVEVGDVHPVLERIPGHPQQFEGTEVRREKREPGDPGAVLPARQKEIVLVRGETLEVVPDPEDEDEVEAIISQSANASPIVFVIPLYLGTVFAVAKETMPRPALETADERVPLSRSGTPGSGGVPAWPDPGVPFGQRAERCPRFETCEVLHRDLGPSTAWISSDAPSATETFRRRTSLPSTRSVVPPREPPEIFSRASPSVKANDGRRTTRAPVWNGTPEISSSGAFRHGHSREPALRPSRPVVVRLGRGGTLGGEPSGERVRASSRRFLSGEKHQAAVEENHARRLPRPNSLGRSCISVSSRAGSLNLVRPASANFGFRNSGTSPRSFQDLERTSRPQRRGR